MSNGGSEVKLEVVRGIFDLLRSPWVIAALIIGIGMFTGVLTKENIESVAGKVMETVKGATQ